MKYKVAFSGAGVLGRIHCGAICAFMDLGITITEVAGTSAGSIAAALVACEKTSDEIRAIALADLPGGILGYEPLAIFSQGYNSGKIFLKYCQSIFGDVRFSNLNIPLTIVATDINGGGAYRFSNKDTPDVLLSDACRASSSVPFFFSPHFVNGIKLLDGGMCQNVPVDQLSKDDTPRLGIEVMHGVVVGTTKTLIGLAGQSVTTMLASNEGNLTAWAQETGAKILQVNADPYSFMSPSLTLEQKTDLFERGYDAVIGLFK